MSPNPDAKRYWCSSPNVTGEVTVLDGIIYQTPAVWYRWRGRDFEVFKHACHVDKCEEMEEGK